MGLNAFGILPAVLPALLQTLHDTIHYWHGVPLCAYCT
jgi:hypothetical protein